MISRHLYILRVFFLFVVLIPQKWNAQNQYNFWYFGYKAGFDFNGGAPVAVLNSAMDAPEGCASYCNSAGQLLYYTDGTHVWDNTHTVMPNGDMSLTTGVSSLSSLQSSVFVPVYNDSNICYVFGNAGIPSAGPGMLYYASIDKRLNSGKGDINSPVKTLITTGTSERIVAVKHCNGMDHWVVTHINGTNTFYSFRVTKCGIMDTVISSVGPIGESGLNALKASPKGDKLSTVMIDDSISRINIYDFNNATGTVTGYITIDTCIFPERVTSNTFSPGGNLFYLNHGSSGGSIIYQYNLNAPVIAASKTAISPTHLNIAADIQIGRDGKLYICLFGRNFIDAINIPDIPGIGCGYTPGVVSLGTKIGRHSLPNHISDYLNPLPVRPYTAGFSWSSLCTNNTVSFTDTSVICAPVKYHKWDFGDPSSGINNKADVLSPTHSYSSPGTYTVSLVISDGCNTDTATSVIIVQPDFPISLSEDTSICIGESVSLSAGGASTYLWSTGVNTYSTSVSPAATSVYTLTVSNGSCSYTDMITVTVLPEPLANAGNSISISSGDTVVLTASGGETYLWSPAEGLSCTSCPDPKASPQSTTVYYVTVTDAGGCSASDSLVVTVTERCEENLLLPNIFTPNGDGINDRFIITGFDNCFNEYSLTIYNRWGTLIYSGSPVTETWEGKTSSGEQAADGTYYYMLAAKEKVIKGFITLIR